MKKNRLARFEYLLLTFLILCKVILLLRYWNTPLGYDIDSHLEYIGLSSWFGRSVDLNATYYAFHPPLVFLLARIFLNAGFSLLHSAMLVSFACSVGSFLFLRAAVSRLGMLMTPFGIAFLYLTAGIPMQAYLSLSVNIDSAVLCIASALLWTSVTIALRKSGDAGEWTPYLLVTSLLTLGLFTKYIGLVLFPLPFLLLFLSDRLSRKRKFKRLMLSAIVALCLAFPYYYLRYQIPKGTMLYTSTGDYFANDILAQSIARRDGDLAGFFTGLFLPPRSDGLQPSFFPTWKSFWLQGGRRAQSPLAGQIGNAYAWIAATLVLTGIGRIVTNRKRHGIGIVFLGFSLFFLMFLIWFAYLEPVGGYFAVKGTYVTPVLWTIGYCMTAGLEFLFSLFSRKKTGFPGWILLPGLSAFMGITFLLPVF